MLHRGSRPDHSSWFYNLCTQLKQCSFIWRHKLKAGITGVHLKTKWSLKNPGSALTTQNQRLARSVFHPQHCLPGSQECPVPRTDGKGSDGFFKDWKEEQGVETEVWIQREGSGDQWFDHSSLTDFQWVPAMLLCNRSLLQL